MSNERQFKFGDRVKHYGRECIFIGWDNEPLKLASLVDSTGGRISARADDLSPLTIPEPPEGYEVVEDLELKTIPKHELLQLFFKDRWCGKLTRLGELFASAVYLSVPLYRPIKKAPETPAIERTVVELTDAQRENLKTGVSRARFDALTPVAETPVEIKVGSRWKCGEVEAIVNQSDRTGVWYDEKGRRSSLQLPRDEFLRIWTPIPADSSEPEGVGEGYRKLTPGVDRRAKGDQCKWAGEPLDRWEDLIGAFGQPIEANGYIYRRPISKPSVVSDRENDYVTVKMMQEAIEDLKTLIATKSEEVGHER